MQTPVPGPDVGACDVPSTRRQILPALAANPALLPEHIDDLIATASQEVLQELACEQRLSPAQVAALAGGEHRAVQLALIRSSNLPITHVRRDDPWELLAGIDRADAPADWLPLLASWPDIDVRSALAESIMDRDRADIAEILASDDDCSVAARATALYDLPERLAERLYQRTEACIRIAFATKERPPALFVAELIATGGLPAMEPCLHAPDLITALRDLRLAAAGNRSIPFEAVDPFMAALDPVTALVLARRRDLPAVTYADLVALHVPQVTGTVAMNPAAPADLLCRLYDQDSGRWRQNVLANTAAPLHLLVRHSRATAIPQWNMRQDVEELRKLAADPDPAVRLVAISSHLTPPDVRAVLLDDPDFAVAKRALYGTVTAEQIRASAARHGPRMFTSLAAHPACPPDVLLAIVRDPQSPPGAVTEVAWHDAAPSSALRVCHQHPASAIPLACNPSTPPDILVELATHADPQVVLEVARNPSLPPDAASHILRDHARQS